MALSDYTSDQLLEEIARRGDASLASAGSRSCPTCKGKWSAYMGSYDGDGYTLRCAGCLRAVAKCRCSR